MNKQEAKGYLQEAKGAVKETVGKAIGNRELQLKGKLEKVAGELEVGLGNLKSEVKKRTA